MSARRTESTTPHSSARLIDLNELPLEVLEIELSAPPAELISDTTVVLLHPEQGRHAAVLKVARGVLGAAELRTQRRVLAELAIHHRLDEEWRELVPRILAFNERPDATTSVESYRPGTDLGEMLARHPDCAEELSAAALTAIAPLHRRTATFVGVDNICYLRRWVIEPLADLMYVCQRLDPQLEPEVDRLGTMLRQALIGRRIPVSWTHGDYTPGNVRVADMHGPVTGIVDWAGARPGRPAFIDEYLMLLSVSCQVERTDLGAIVGERLLTGGLSECERDALRAARKVDGNHKRADAQIDERIAILLTWLHRISDLWRKRATHPNQHHWWAANVAPVLFALAAEYGSQGSDFDGWA